MTNLSRQQNTPDKRYYQKLKIQCICRIVVENEDHSIICCIDMDASKFVKIPFLCNKLQKTHHGDVILQYTS